MTACRLVALDEDPGVRPVGIGEIYRRLWVKCLLKAIGTQATAQPEEVAPEMDVDLSTQPQANEVPSPDAELRATVLVDAANGSMS